MVCFLWSGTSPRLQENSCWSSLTSYVLDKTRQDALCVGGGGILVITNYVSSNWMFWLEIDVQFSWFRLTSFVFMSMAAYNGHAECLRILLENVENDDAVNSVDDQGRTPLMVAVSNGHIDATLLLLHYRSKLNLQDIHHRTALHRGVRVGLNMWPCAA